MRTDRAAAPTRIGRRRRTAAAPPPPPWIDRRRRPNPTQVYDLNQQGNEFLSAIGLGLYHTGVEVGGREYS